ncbi:MAG: response regulator [Proteobacteria bacterium]|nr:response regulator [Pseudomonadota bacterium]
MRHAEGGGGGGGGCNELSRMLFWSKFRGVEKPMVKILVIDDDQAQALLISSYLSKHGYSVVAAFDPVEGMKQLLANDFQLVITDLMMPHIDGISFAEKIHAIERMKDLPIIMVTAYPSEELSEKSMRRGIALVLSKPINLSKLRDLVGFSTGG